MSAELPIRFDKNDLVPVVVRDVESGDVLMLAYMNEAALEATRRTGRSHFWSRSRQELWKKGETSGHEQIVEEILVNCEQNSLLLNVRQIGAVCHDGYDTCFYRRLAADGSLAVQRDRVFDPATVYTRGNVESQSRLWFDAYRYLADHDLSDVSRTSAILHDPAYDPAARIVDELRELAGVIDGSHKHADPIDDALLEGTQVLYWLAIASIKLGLTWDEVRPDRALQTGEGEFDQSSAAKLLAAEADKARFESAHSIHGTMALVAQACLSMGVSTRMLFDAELADLNKKPYLEGYFGDAIMD